MINWTWVISSVLGYTPPMDFNTIWLYSPHISGKILQQEKKLEWHWEAHEKLSMSPKFWDQSGYNIWYSSVNFLPISGKLWSFMQVLNYQVAARRKNVVLTSDLKLISSHFLEIYRVPGSSKLPCGRSKKKLDILRPISKLWITCSRFCFTNVWSEIEFFSISWKLRSYRWARNCHVTLFKSREFWW